VASLKWFVIDEAGNELYAVQRRATAHNYARKLRGMGQAVLVLSLYERTLLVKGYR
jgi:hypothetical protein